MITIPYTRLHCKWLKNHTLSSGTYPYSQYMEVLPTPFGGGGGGYAVLIMKW